MTDIWDFSNLLESWGKNSTSSTKEAREFPEVKTQLDEELSKLQTELDLLKNPSSTTKNETNFLTTPLPPLTSVNEGTPSITPRQVESALEKRPKPIAQLTKPNAPSRIVKPKDGFQLHTTRQFKPRVQQKIEYYFKAEPKELKVVNFSLNTEYIMTFTIQNITSHTKGFQLRGPTDGAFRFRILEGVENSLVRPGLHLTFEVTFYPEEPRDYESAFLFIPGPDEPITKVPIHCFRDPPALALPDIVDLSAALVYSSRTGSFTVTNNGGTALFYFKSNTGRDTRDSYIDGPFSLFPPSFKLDNGESTKIEIKFSPTETGEHKRSFEILAQHFPQKFFFMAQGESSDPSLKFEICPDLQLFVPFLPQDTGTSKTIKIVNETDVEYPFHVQTVPVHKEIKSELFALYPEHQMEADPENLPAPFAISPICSVVKPKDSFSLCILFDPTMFSSYFAKLLIYADKIPDNTGHLGSVKMLTVNIEASTGPTSVMIQPPLVIYNNIVPKTNMTKVVELMNQSFLDIKLQWRKSDLITPNPVLFEVKPNNKKIVELNCLLSKKSQRDNQNAIIFKHQPELALQAKASEIWHITSVPQNQPPAVDPNSNMKRSPSSQLYAINFLDNENEHSTNLETIQDDFESLNTANAKIKQCTSCVFNKPIGVMPSLINTSVLKQIQVAHLTDEVTFSMNSFNSLAFTYTATINPPLLTVKPPILEFGCALTGQIASEKVTFINDMSCPIGYEISFPDKKEWNIQRNTGFVTDRKEVYINLQFDNPVAIEELITVKTFWCDENGKKINSLPNATFDIPVYAIFDRPIVQVKDRIIDIGEVFPTLEYSTSTEINLLNIFPTHFEFVDASNSVELMMPLPEDITDASVTLFDHKAVPFHGKLPQHSSSSIIKENSSIINILDQNKRTTVYEYTKTSPSKGELNTVDKPSSKIELITCFCRLGENALPFLCKVIGTSIRCAIIAHVQPPKITLLSEKIDFSNDFVICNRSHCHVRVKNECGVASTVQVVMIDNCNSVFSLDNDKVFNVAPFGSAEIPVSCYSEIHGDYNGELKLIIKDPWQYKEINIPMHVKALGSFFGFKKHTLGYTLDIDGDYIYFGNTEINSQSTKVIRRLTLVNFSSESITVDWSISNFVVGRKCAKVNLDIGSNGKVILNIKETEEANVQDPFSLVTAKSVIESHGKTVVVVEFSPKDVGEFRGCVAARSGEFIHTLGLYAVCV